MKKESTPQFLKIKKPRMLFVFGLFLTLFMLLYEYVERMIFPDITGWESQGVAILATSIVGTLAAYFLLRRSDRVNKKMSCYLQELEDTKEALQANEEMYRSLVESTGDSIYVVGRDTRYLFMNNKHRNRMGLSEDDYKGQDYGRFHFGDEAMDFRKQVNTVLQTGESRQYEHKSQRDQRDFIRTFSPIRNKDGWITAVTVVSTDISRQKGLEESLRSLSITDPLTGLYNRRGLFALAEQQIKMINRSHKWLSVIFTDLDGLKSINDKFGHQEGDAALIRTADILRDTFRESDIIARIGGDEFVAIIVTDEKRSPGATQSRLKKNLDAHHAKANAGYSLSLSTGIVVYDPVHPVSFEDLLREADRIMYATKKRKS
jgi:diguanylate cyclase (GGDEF)-like protein/PAS domain S-box-containing protein